MRLVICVLTSCTASLTLSIYRSVFAVTQSGRSHSGGGAARRPLAAIDTQRPMLLVVRSCLAPPADPRESRRQETEHTTAQMLFDKKINNNLLEKN